MHASRMEHANDLIIALTFAASGFATIAEAAPDPVIRELASVNFRRAAKAIEAAGGPRMLGEPH